MKTIYVLLFASVLFCSIGCSPRNTIDGFPKIYPCEIKLIQDGKPLSDCRIVLHSKDPAIVRWPIGGKTDDSGNATITTYGKFSGAPSGSYTVTLSREEIVYDGPPRVIGDETIPGPGKVFSTINTNILDPGKSPLRIEVEERKNHFELDAGKKVYVQIDVFE